MMYLLCKNTRSRTFLTCCQPAPAPPTTLKMATGRVRIGWSLRAPKTETRNRNPNPNPKPIRVEIHYQNQTRGYPKPEWINIHIFTCIDKRQQIINIFMTQLSINLIV